MRQTLSHGWRFLTSKLHQPLPLNRRESQKLLTLLNDSFKRNLDRQYPPGLADSEYSPDDHFKALLRSPLFGSDRLRHASPSQKRADGHRDAAQLHDLMFAVKAPIEYFKQQVATGAANMDLAKLALDSQKKKALASASLDVNESMKSSGIGSVMVNWLWSSGQYERLDFLRDREFVARLMPFLVVGGQYKPIWEWLQRSRTLSTVQTQTHEAWVLFQKDIGSMVRNLVKSETTYGQGLQSAMQLFLTNYKASTLLSPAPSFLTLSMNNHPAGSFLIMEWASNVTSVQLQAPVIEKFGRSVDSWASPHLSVSYGALIQLLLNREANNPPVQPLITAFESFETSLSKFERLSVVRVGLKAVEVLLTQGSLKEAAQVMKTLQVKFASELGADDELPNPRKEDEDAALRSLNLILAT
ncbi:MAG: hypothetical protein Q9225_007438 [Loekoesia sp. 1 TL-2023]